MHMLFIDNDTLYKRAIYLVWIKFMDSGYDLLEWKSLIAISIYSQLAISQIIE